MSFRIYNHLLALLRLSFISDLDSISDPVACRINYTGSCPSARLAADDVACGPHCADVSANWPLTWHANVTEIPTSDFDVVFTSGFVFSSSTQWCLSRRGTYTTCAVNRCCLFQRSGVPSKRNQFTRQYEAQWKDDLSMFTNIEAARVISSAFKASMEIPLFQWSQISRHPEWMPQINAWFRRFEHRFYWDDEHDTVVRRVWENHAAIRLRDFWYDTQKKAKKTARDKGFQGWNDVAVWRDFKPIYIPEDIWPHYLQHVTSERFTRRSQSAAPFRFLHMRNGW
ncbi:uncharacterized protein [Populus alba]|uniref:uncharacterized protein n=1 Tax=Populus alba TaxID=43335 RepID=UPI003CC6E4C9